jgi:hypothetical protein
VSSHCDWGELHQGLHTAHVGIRAGVEGNLALIRWDGFCGWLAPPGVGCPVSVSQHIIQCTHEQRTALICCREELRHDVIHNGERTSIAILQLAVDGGTGGARARTIYRTLHNK